MAAQYFLQYCDAVVFLCLLHIPWISMDILSDHDCVLVKLKSDTDFWTCRYQPCNFLTDLIHAPDQVAIASFMGSALGIFFFLVGSLSLKNRVPHVIDHG